RPADRLGPLADRRLDQRAAEHAARLPRRRGGRAGARQARAADPEALRGEGLRAALRRRHRFRALFLEAADPHARGPEAREALHAARQRGAGGPDEEPGPQPPAARADRHPARAADRPRRLRADDPVLRADRTVLQAGALHARPRLGAAGRRLRGREVGLRRLPGRAAGRGARDGRDDRRRGARAQPRRGPGVDPGDDRQRPEADHADREGDPDLARLPRTGLPAHARRPRARGSLRPGDGDAAPAPRGCSEAGHAGSAEMSAPGPTRGRTLTVLARTEDVLLALALAGIVLLPISDVVLRSFSTGISGSTVLCRHLVL